MRPIDEQRERLLRIVAVGFLILMAAIAIGDVGLLLTSSARRLMYGVDLALTVVMALAVMAVQSLARRDQYMPAAWLLVGIFAARTIVTIGVIAPEQLSVMAPGYLVVIVLAQVLIGSRAGLITGLCSILMFLLAYAGLRDRPDLASSFLGSVFASLFLYAAVGGFVEIALRHMDQALRRANVLLAENEKARRSLQESEEQFRALTESSPTGVIIQQDGHIVYGNSQFAAMAHSIREDVFGLSFWEFFAPEDVELLQTQLARRRSAGGGSETTSQLLFTPPTGVGIRCEVAAADAVYRDRPAVVANVLDVSARVTAEREMQREREFANDIINAADAIIMALDAEGNMVRFNPAGERLTGYEEAELVGRPYGQVLCPADDPDACNELARNIHERKQLRGQLEAPWITKAGEELVIAWRYVAQTDGAGEVTGVIAVGIDVTQQRILERQAMATERLRALGQMAGGVAHDLNNTLAGILGPAELLLLEEEDVERQKELSAISLAAQRGAETVRRIQRFSQARTDLDRQVFNLHEIVDDVVHTLRPRWRDQPQREGFTIKVDNQVDENALVVGSSGEIGNVMTNLIVNACDAMPSGGEVLIEGSQDGNMTELTVSDTGTGISYEDLGSIFQPFHSTKGADNSGLGLAVVRGIILRHGGHINVSSEVGVGTTFSISLPAAPALEGKPEEAMPGADRSAALRFLVVDDSKPIADFAAAALRKMGQETTVVYAGEAALTHLQETEFDVLLTDYGMEGLSGVNLAREAKQLQPAIKAVLMTGWDVSEADFGEFDASLPKPFTLGELSEVVTHKLRA